MPVYQVVRKSDGEEVTRYCAGQVTESLDGNAFPLSDFDHVEHVDGTSITLTGPRRLTKLAFIDRLGELDAVVQVRQQELAEIEAKIAKIKKQAASLAGT